MRRSLLIAALAACHRAAPPPRAPTAPPTAAPAHPHPEPDPDPDPGAAHKPAAPAAGLHATGSRDTLSIEETWKKGQLDGPRRIYRQKLLVLEEHYGGGGVDGDWTAYLTNGKPRAEGRYRLGKQDGTWTTWYSNGKVQSTGDYTDG